MMRQNGTKLILFLLLAVIFGVVFWKGRSFEKPAADILFKKLSSFRALFEVPDTALLPVVSDLKIKKEAPEGFLEAVIIFRPPAISYDQLIAAKGQKDGVERGNFVLAGKLEVIGTIEEVFDETSRINAFSSYGREVNVFLENQGVWALAMGRGNGELEVTLPRDHPASVGERAFLLTATPYLVGFVESIESSASAATKILKIKQPFNVNELYSVFILTNNL